MKWNDWLTFGVYALFVYLFLFYAQSLGLFSVLASTTLPLPLTVGDTGCTAYGVMVAGVPLSASAPAPCSGADISRAGGSEGAGSGNIQGASCWEGDISWNGMTTHYRTDSQPSPLTIGGFLIGHVGGAQVSPSGGRSCGGNGGYLVTLNLEDVKNFYETSFVSHPNLVKLQHGSVPAVINMKSLLSVPSLGGLTIKDDTKILRTEVQYRFTDENIIKVGNNIGPLDLNDKTLGNIVTSIQPHFYVVQSETTYVNNPNRAASTSSDAASGINTGLKVGGKSVTLAERLEAIRTNNLLFAAGIHTSELKGDCFGDQCQTKNPNNLETSQLIQQKELTLFVKTKKLEDSKATLVRLNKGNGVWLEAVNDYKLAKGVVENSGSLTQLDKANAAFNLKAAEDKAVANAEYRQRSSDVELKASYPDLVQYISSSWQFSNLGSFDKIAAVEELQQGELNAQAVLNKDISSLQSEIDKYNGGSGVQSVFNLFSAGTFGATTPDLAQVGSESSNGDFLVQNSVNRVYKFLFLEGAKETHLVGANLDYSKYQLIDDQYTPFNKKIILKGGGGEVTPSGVSELSPIVDPFSASWSKLLMETPLRSFGLKTSSSSGGSKQLFFIVLLGLGAVTIFWRRN